MTNPLLALVLSLASPSPATPANATPAPVLAVHRAQAMAWLHAYEEAGQYPTDPRGWPLSVFRDAHGVRCPMAELIYRSGRADLVDAVVAQRNDVRLADIHEGPLADWMAQSGLTRAEIVMIQGLARMDRYQNLYVMPPLVETTSAHERLRGRLETAEAALHVATAQAIPVAHAESAKPRVHAAPVVPTAPGRATAANL